MKKKNGFTLAELLVVVVILGIITGISIPLIRSLTEKNRQREYTTYLETLKQSAKLYVNSYEEDLFGHENSGCAIIRYSQLEEKKLIKDIAVRDVSCDSEDTYVKVVKLDGKTSYASTIRCGSRNADGGINVETQLSDKEMGDINNCGLDNKTIISFSATDPSDSINYQRRNLVVNMNSHTGFHENLLIEYGFLKKENKPAEGENPTSYLIDGWKKLDVNYIGGNEQKRKIEDGESITLSSNKIIIPKNQTEDLYLVLKIHSLKDLGGRNWTTEIGRGNYVYFGTYRVDNSKPVFSADSTIVSNNSSYNSKDPKLKINVTDNRYSTSNDLRMCISYDSDTCSKKVKDIKNNNGYEKYDSTKVLPKIKEDLDGSNHTIFVTVGDAAGNYETKAYSYKLATSYTITYNSNGGNLCEPSSKTVIYDDATGKTWGNLCTPTRAHYVFDGWRNQSNTNITVDANSPITVRKINLIANWTPAPKASINCSNLNYNGNEQVACSCAGGTIGGEYKATRANKITINNAANQKYTATCAGDDNHTDADSVQWDMSVVWEWKGYYHTTSKYSDQNPYTNRDVLNARNGPNEEDKDSKKCSQNCKKFCGNSYTFWYCTDFLNEPPIRYDRGGGFCWCGKG